ncbi:hypothetical protein BGX34_009473 [Mortierella sp. NVP85]|nr:hypothetical protein BGX34_009473 [Mortierella sp. NVP85]
MTLPLLISAVPTGPAAAAAAAVQVGAALPSSLEKRAIHYQEESETEIELTVEANDSYSLEILRLNECVSKFATPSVAGTTAFKYNALALPEPDMVVNFYTDNQCQEYEFSMVSEVHQFVGYFASIKYVGQFSEVKPGVYDSHEISKTALPSGQPLPDTFTLEPSDDPVKGSGGGGGGGAGGAGGGKTDAPPLTSDDPAKIPSPNSPSSGTSSAGFIVGVGIIGIVTIAGVVGLSVLLYRKHGNKRGGDARFMTVSTGDDDEGENGPHSSALMQSRVDASFDDERPQTGYRDENDEVELSGYPQQSPPESSQK